MGLQTTTMRSYAAVMMLSMLLVGVVEDFSRRQDLSHLVEVQMEQERKTSLVKVSAVAVVSCRHKVPSLSVGVRMVLARKIDNQLISAQELRCEQLTIRHVPGTPS